MTQELKDKIDQILHTYADADDRDIVSRLKQVIQEMELRDIRFTPSKNVADLIFEHVDRLKQPFGNTNLIKTGFEGVDGPFGGFGLGEFVVIGARPAMGKTSLLVNLALQISVDMPVLYFSFDMSEEALTYRFISVLSSIPIDGFLKHDLTEEQKAQLPTAEEAFRHHQLFLNAGGYNGSVSALRAHCQKMVEEKGIKVIIVDYLQMMSSNRYRNSRELEINYISRELKNIAKDFNVCVIASSQLSRAVESRPGNSKRPMLSDLRDSGAIEQDADKVFFLYRPEYYGLTEDEEGRSTAGVAELIIGKNRNGGTGIVRLMFSGKFSRFSDYDDGYEPYQTGSFSFLQNRLDELSPDTPF